MGKRRKKRELKKIQAEKRARSAYIDKNKKQPQKMRTLKWGFREFLNDLGRRYSQNRVGSIIRMVYATLMIAFLVSLFLKGLAPFRLTLTFDIIRCTCLSSLPLFFAYVSNHRPKKTLAKVFMTLIAAYFWLKFLHMPPKISLLIGLIICWASVLYAIGLRTFKEEQYTAFTSTVVAFSFIFMVAALEDYTYLKSPGGLHFWVLALIFGVVCGIVALILWFAEIFVPDDNTVGNAIGWVIVVAFAAFFMFMSTAQHLNYALDTEPPEEATVIITQKEISGSKSVHYELFFWYDGEERTLEVGRDEYALYEIGDRFDIEICQGAFDDAFIKQK